MQKTEKLNVKNNGKHKTPDTFLAVARQGFHGLYIELKRADHSNHPTPEQLWWIGRLRAEGYRCEVCYGCDAAWTVIQDYLGEKITQ